MRQRILEGRWEEIRRHDAELAGHRVKLIITDTEAETKNLPSTASQPEGKTLYDRLKGHIGLVHSGSKERLSENCGEKFTDYLEEKRRQGHL